VGNHDRVEFFEGAFAFEELRLCLAEVNLSLLTRLAGVFVS
jgi:hypothetical protein